MIKVSLSNKSKKWLNEINKQKDYDKENLEFVWGVKSWDDLSDSEANLYTMNDLDIVYDKKTHWFYLGLETIYDFDNGNEGEIKYLERLLEKFTTFMMENGYAPPKTSLKCFDISELFRAGTIEDLYGEFYLFVKGYKALCEVLDTIPSTQINGMLLNDGALANTLVLPKDTQFVKSAYRIDTTDIG